MVFKIEIEQAHKALAEINSKWLEWYAENGRNPKDNVTNAYCSMTEIDGFGYIRKDGVTELYMPKNINFEIVDEINITNFEKNI